MLAELTRVAAGEAGLAQTPLELLGVHLTILQHKPESAEPEGLSEEPARRV